jgi:hypothetical protein
MDPRNRNIEPSFFFILKNPKKRKETRHTHTYSNKRRAPYSRGRLCNKLSSRTGRPTGPSRIERFSPLPLSFSSTSTKIHHLLRWDGGICVYLFFFIIFFLVVPYPLRRLRGNCQWHPHGKWHSHRVEIWHFLINQLKQLPHHVIGVESPCPVAVSLSS